MKGNDFRPTARTMLHDAGETWKHQHDKLIKGYRSPYSSSFLLHPQKAKFHTSGATGAATTGHGFGTGVGCALQDTGGGIGFDPIAGSHGGASNSVKTPSSEDIRYPGRSRNLVPRASVCS